MKLDSNDFELFGLPERFALDRAEIDARWRSLQARVHPDRFVAEGAASRRLSAQWAVRVNEAYHRLKDPVRRAAALCELRGAPIAAHTNTAMPPEFLLQQLEWREALDAAASDADLDALENLVTARRQAGLAALQDALDLRHDAAGAAQQVRALMFVERFADDVASRREALGQ